MLLAELKRNPKLAQAFAAMLAQQVMTLRTRLERRNIDSARDRVRHFLAVNVGADGRTVALSGTLKELAADLGLTHEALYRTLARMEAEGDIKRADGTGSIREDRMIAIISRARKPGYVVDEGAHGNEFDHGTIIVLESRLCRPRVCRGRGTNNRPGGTVPSLCRSANVGNQVPLA